MGLEVDQALHDLVLGDGADLVHKDVALLDETVDDVTQQVVAVDGRDLDADGVGAVRVFLEGSRHDGIAILGSELDGFRTMPGMQGQPALLVLEAHDIVAGQGIADGAALEARILLVLEQFVQPPARLEGLGEIQPFGLGTDGVADADLHAVAPVKLGPQGR